MVTAIPLLLMVLANDPSGLEIMELNKARHELEDETRKLEMTLVDRRGKTKTRLVEMRNTKTSEGLERLMLVFIEPRDVSGTGLLTWEQSKREDDQWLYLPSLKKEKRISSGSKRSKFMGTDFTYEDLRVENLDKHIYEVVGEDEHEGKAVWLVQATISDPKELRKSGYSRRVLWVRKDIYFTAKIDYYDRKNRHIKALVNGEPVRVSDEAWRSDHFVMSDLIRKTRTEMKVLERTVNQGLDENDFTLRKLKSF